MAMYAKVRRMRFRDGLSISEIARRTSLSRNTIKDVAAGAGPQRDAPTGGAAAPKKIGPYEAPLRRGAGGRCAAAAARAPHGAKLLRAAPGAGICGQLCARDRLHPRVARGRRARWPRATAFVPLSFAWGEAFQFDWSEEGLVIGGVWRKLQVAHMKLCASRAFWLVALSQPRATRCCSTRTRAA